MELNLEEERGRLSALTKKRKESLKNHYFPDRPLLDDFIKGQRKLVTALEQLGQAATHIADLLDDNARIGLQLEQAREALELVRSIIADGALTGFNCHSGDWAERLFKSQAVTFAALKQQEVGNGVQ